MPPPAEPPSLEEQVLGVWEDPATAAVAKAPPSPAAARGPDAVGSVLLPVVVCLALVLVILWSLSKSLQYNELFHHNPRYQYALWSLNVGAVVLATLVLCCHPRRP